MSIEMHHANWQRLTWQKHPDPIIRAARCHPALILPAPHTNHRLIHAAMPPTPIPNKKVASDMLDQFGYFKPSMDRVELFRSAAAHLLTQAMSHPSMAYADSAQELGQHYSDQLEFITMDEGLAAKALRRYTSHAI